MDRLLVALPRTARRHADPTEVALRHRPIISTKAAEDPQASGPGAAVDVAPRAKQNLCSDVGGIAVHIGARVAGVAGPGEVVVSGTVKDLVVGSGIAFTDRGIHSLKGAPGEWRLYAVGR